ncbi:MAG: hypothetical protein ACREUL_16890 [Steroidobacteraceae bacterium]
MSKTIDPVSDVAFAGDALVLAGQRLSRRPLQDVRFGEQPIVASI